MNAEIIAVGTEILIGSIVNTHAQYLSQKLAGHGIDVYHHTTVGDNIGRLVQAFEQAAKRADILIVSGGLGPTEDDITAKAAARFLGKDLVFHKPTYKAIQLKLQKLNRKVSPLIQKQCWVPANPEAVFQNDHGTAPGILSSLVINNKKVWLLCLPGPPRELKPLFEKKVLPYLLNKLRLKKQHLHVRTLKICGMESTVAEKVNDLMKLKPPVTLGIYAKLGLVELKIMAKDSTEKKTRAHIARLEKSVRKRLGSTIYGADQETLSDAVGNLLIKHRKTLALAESCTGGLIGHEITQTAGASRFFKGSVVAYSNGVKIQFLNVPAELIKKHGAVSAETAKSMAQNIRLKFGTDVGLSITGIAGPSGGSLSKPVGLVYIGIAGKNGVSVTQNNFMGNRSEIKQKAALQAMEQLRIALIKH